MSMEDWQPIHTAPRDGTIVEIVADTGEGPGEAWPMRWVAGKGDGQTPGFWTVSDGSFTWREGDGGPTHWRPRHK